MTFVPPAKTVDPAALLLAADILSSANRLFFALKTFQKENFELFWYQNGVLRSADAINAILIQMDAASPGQSGRFFASAVGLVQLILSNDPSALQDRDWHPKYNYTTDPTTFAVRMIAPDPEPEPEPDPQE